VGVGVRTRRVWPAVLVLIALGFVVIEAHAGVSRPLVERRLANGLRVLVCPDPGGVDVSVLVHYDVGSRDEPGGLEGLAHLTEHLMFTGSKHVARGDFERLLERAGAVNVNAETNVDGTFFHETMPPERLDLALWLESDRMGYLLDRLGESELDHERAAVLNEHRLRITENTLGALEGIVRTELFPPWHPYSHVVAGSPRSIAGIGLADARAFLATWYGPGNATLLISGKVDPALALGLAERYFGALPARPPPKRPPLPPLQPPSARVIHVGAGVTRSELRIAWLTPPLHAPGDLELDIVANVLTDKDSGWLRRRLMDAPRIAASVIAVQRSMELASIFEIRAVVAEGHTNEEVLAIVDDALARFETSVDAREVGRAQLAWFNTRLFRLESSQGWAISLALALRGKQAPALFDGQIQRHSAMSGAAVGAAPRAFLGRAHRVVTMIEPVKGAPLRGVLLSRQELSP